MNTGKEIITKFHSISDAELSLADTQWLIQNIDKAINSTKQAGQVEPVVKPEIAGIPGYYSKEFINFLLVNALRCLTEEQRHTLVDILNKLQELK